MITRKFRINCDGQFIGIILLSDNNPRFPNCKVATIWPFSKQGNWTTGDLELVGQRSITDIYDLQTTDDEILNDLIIRIGINREGCRNFDIVLYAND
jgi:hypothetical protein